MRDHFWQRQTTGDFKIEITFTGNHNSKKNRSYEIKPELILRNLKETSEVHFLP